MRTSQTHDDRRRNGSRGSATIELALALPLLATVGFGALEFGQAFVVREMLVTAAFEAARVGSQSSCPRPTTSEVIAATVATLSSSGLDVDATTISLTNVGGEAGTDVVVRLSYPVQLPVTSRLLNLPWTQDGVLTMDVDVVAENE